MLSNLFDSSTIPVLEQVVKFTQSRHGVLAGNIANIDTPGYKSRDLSVTNFQERLRDAIAQRHQAAASPSSSLAGYPQGQSAKTDSADWHQVEESAQDILFHDQHDVSLETQITEISKNFAQHNMALSIMNSQFQLLRSAIAERP